MAMSWIYFGIILLSTIFGMGNKSMAALSAAVLQGAQKGITLGLSIAGSLCLWSGVSRLMEKAGITGFLAKLLSPILYRLFPSAKEDPALAGALSGNITANILGLGNAATPMGIRAAGHMVKKSGMASDELCRLIVLNTASIQLIPANVAALRASLGCETPFDILPAVWLTSLFSAGMGLAMACFLGKVWKDG